MRVSLAQARHPLELQTQSSERDAACLADPRGPRVVLGGEAGGSKPIVPSAASLFGARAAVLASPGGPLVVADTGHHRLLIWHRAPEIDATPADILFGQPDFATEGRNARGAVSERSCNVPVGVAMRNGMLAVADSWNHRVLVWFAIPVASNTPPDVVLGQGTRDAGIFNRGKTVAADTMYWCSGVAFTERGLLVADTGNRRVLYWNRVPERDGRPADLVLGQHDFETRDENAGGAPGPIGMRWPHDLLVAPDGKLIVSDAGNNRLMIWNEMPTATGGRVRRGARPTRRDRRRSQRRDVLADFVDAQHALRLHDRARHALRRRYRELTTRGLAHERITHGIDRLRPHRATGFSDQGRQSLGTRGARFTVLAVRRLRMRRYARHCRFRKQSRRAVGSGMIASRVAFSVRVRGLVQGVGFSPERLASREPLRRDGRRA